MAWFTRMDRFTMVSSRITPAIVLTRFNGDHVAKLFMLPLLDNSLGVSIEKLYSLKTESQPNGHRDGILFPKARGQRQNSGKPYSEESQGNEEIDEDKFLNRIQAIEEVIKPIQILGQLLVDLNIIFNKRSSFINIIIKYQQNIKDSTLSDLTEYFESRLRRTEGNLKNIIQQIDQLHFIKNGCPLKIISLDNYQFFLNQNFPLVIQENKDEDTKNKDEDTDRNQSVTSPLMEQENSDQKENTNQNLQSNFPELLIRVIKPKIGSWQSLIDITKPDMNFDDWMQFSSAYQCQAKRLEKLAKHIDRILLCSAPFQPLYVNLAVKVEWMQNISADTYLSWRQQILKLLHEGQILSTGLSYVWVTRNDWLRGYNTHLFLSNSSLLQIIRKEWERITHGQAVCCVMDALPYPQDPKCGQSWIAHAFQYFSPLFSARDDSLKGRRCYGYNADN